MKEDTFWSERLRPMLIRDCKRLRLPHHFERVENTVNDGTPDVDWCIAGVAGKIELKFAQDHPVRTATPVLGSAQKGLRRSQVIWNAKRAAAGGRVFLAIGTPQMTWVVDLAGRSPAWLADVWRLTAPELGEISAWCAVHQSAGTLPLALIKETALRGPSLAEIYAAARAVQGESIGPV